MAQTKIYAIFHLNLAFSSIDENSHGEVVEKCYWPLLDTIEKGNIPLGIEVTAYTLECILKAAPDWITEFRRLLHVGKCELLASGDSQIAGPLTPAIVNKMNLELAQSSYKKILDVTPQIAFVNEQAISAGLLDIYLDCGFEAVVVEWDNPYSHNPEWHKSLLYKPQTLATASNKTIKVLWNNSASFQKLQKYAYGEIVLEDYIEYIDKTLTPNFQCFSVYGSDAEVFDYRPGRYENEFHTCENQWGRLSHAFEALSKSSKYQWCTPSQALEFWKEDKPLKITNGENPISVKKQARYNITRWGLTGKNDLLLNSYCFDALKKSNKQPSSQSNWQALCRLWASDYRTHLTEIRYKQLKKVIANYKHPQSYEPKKGPYNSELFTINYDESRNKLNVSSDFVKLSLDVNMGLCIDTLAFKSHKFSPICGKLNHAHFDHIDFREDYYTNNIFIEKLNASETITDLASSNYRISGDGNKLVISSQIKNSDLDLVKYYVIEDEKISCGFKFINEHRPQAYLRLGYITLLNSNERPWYACHNGGFSLEKFQTHRDVDFGERVSNTVSAKSALGATTGELLFGTKNEGLKLSWDQASCAALPMLSSKKLSNQYLNRCWFSLIETDETLKPSGTLLPFSFTIEPTFSPF